MNTKIKNKIKNHALEESPKECCGFVVENNGVIDVLKCKNISKDPINNFKVSASEFLKIKNSYNPLYIYHSHLDEENFSIMDKNCAEESSIDLILYILKSDTFKHYSSNNSESLKYVGRNINFQKTNCFDLVKLYYKNEFNIDLKFPENFVHDHMLKVNEENFNLILEYAKINTLQVDDADKFINHDILLFNSDGYFHLAIYLGNDKILEQPRNGFSKITNYCNYYKRNKIAGLRRSKNGNS